MIEPSEILFIGLGRSAVGWYRCYMPAMFLGADWVGVQGEPPGLELVTGMVRQDTRLPDYDDYRVVVVQQAAGHKWLNLIRRLQDRGIKVLFEVDDYLRGVPKQKGHDYAKHYTKDVLRKLELCMRVCDGVIVSTEYLAHRYRQFNRNVFVCRNGIDMQRYALTKPERSTVSIGWAGATGHTQAMATWLPAVLEVMREREDTCFVSIGVPHFAQAVAAELGPRRAIGIPFTTIENYPAAMTLLDVAIAPAGKTAWYKGKSDLRWLEAAAQRTPIIADPSVYPEIAHGVTGLHAETPADVKEHLLHLIDDREERDNIGEAAYEYVRDNRAMGVAALQWIDVCRAVAGDYESAYAFSRRS